MSDHGLSHDDVNRTQLGDTHKGGHHEEPDQQAKCELHDSDEAERGEASVPSVRSQERDEPGGRRLDAVDSVPMVRLAHDAEGDVEQLPPRFAALRSGEFEEGGHR